MFENSPSIPVQKKSISPLVGLVSIAVIVGLLLLGVINFFSPAKETETLFVTKFNFVESLSKQIATSSSFNFNELSNKNQAGDIQGSITLVNQGLQNAKGSSQHTQSIVTEVNNLKSIALSLSDQNTKEKALKVVQLLEQRNSKYQSILQYQIQVFSGLSQYYQAIAQQKQVQLTENVDSMINAITSEAIQINQLQFEIEAAYEEFLKTAGISKDAAIQLGDNSIQLSAAPNQLQQVQPTTARLKSDDILIEVSSNDLTVPIVTQEELSEATQSAGVTITITNNGPIPLNGADLILFYGDLSVIDSNNLVADPQKTLQTGKGTMVYPLTAINPGSKTEILFKLGATTGGNNTVKAQVKSSEFVIESEQLVIEAL